MSAGSQSGHSAPSQLFFFPLFRTTATTTGVAAERLLCPLPSGLAALCPGLTPRKPLVDPLLLLPSGRVHAPPTPRDLRHARSRATGPRKSYFVAAPELWAKQARDSGHKPLSKPKASANPLPVQSPLRRPGRDQHHTTPSSRF